MQKKGKDFFWVGYADLMTSLFFVVLVLFTLMFVGLKHETQNLQLKQRQNDSIQSELNKTILELENTNDLLAAAASEVKRIRSINDALLALENKGSYKYNAICRRFELTENVQFGTDSAIIPANQHEQLIKAGMELLELMQEFEQEKDIKFLVLIEGRAAKHENNRRNLKFANNVKDLSYSRSLSLYNLWKRSNIQLNTRNSEVLISGSGFDGLCRYKGENESKNKQIIIQIIPYLTK